MPIQSLSEFVEGPDSIGSSVCSKMESSRSSRALKRRTLLSQKDLQESFLLPAEGDVTFECMFCDESFKRHDDLGKHVLSRHRPTLCEPMVLCIEAEYLSPQEKRRRSAGSEEDAKGEDEGSDCNVCGQTFRDSSNLESHMKKHKDSFTYCCNICRRRFKEPWFLKNHKKAHSSRVGGKNKLQQAADVPITINEIVQEQVSRNITTSYRLCMVCGFYFPDKEALLQHSKIHIKELAGNPKNSLPSKENVNADGSVPNEEFLNFLNLKPSSSVGHKTETTRKWIGELNPFNTYQAWQLATKGKVALGLGRLKEPLFEANAETDLSDKDELLDYWNAVKMNPGSPEEETETIKSEDGEGGAVVQDPEDLKMEAYEHEKPSDYHEKSTLCIDCGKLFKTYHQLVLHSRVHRKDRSDSESSASYEGLLIAESPDPEDGEVKKMEEVSESEDVVDSAPNDKNEDDQSEVKIKGFQPSRQCSYCKKSFRSNYYLNIHLRTHTGEKPYKCDFCDYAAAQKTSLRYHLERHHKFKPGESNARVKSISKSLQLLKKSPEMLPAAELPLESRPSPAPFTDAKEYLLMSKPPKRMSALRNKLIYAKQGFRNSTNEAAMLLPEKPRAATPCQPLDSPSSPFEEISLACAETLDDDPCTTEEQPSPDQSEDLPLHLFDFAVEDDSVPMDLSRKPTEDLSVKLYNSALLAIRACPYCPYKTLYPEVLNIHQRLAHKQNQLFHKNGMRSKNPSLLLKMRRTGCPPALQGVDISPQQLDGVRPKAPPFHPRPATEKPKWPPLQPSKVANSASVGQENKRQPIQQNGPPGSGYRCMQPDLQGISHLLERMPQPQQRRPPWNNPPSSHKSNTIVPAERPYPMVPLWPTQNPFVRPSAAHLELGEPFMTRTKHKIPNSALTTFLNADLVRKFHPGQVRVISQENPPAKTVNLPLPSKATHTCEGDLRWGVMRSYEHPAAGPLYRIPNTPLNQGSTSALEVMHAPLYRRESKGDLGANEKST